MPERGAHGAKAAGGRVSRRVACCRLLMLAGTLALPGLLAGCSEEKGPEPIRYDREVCEICNMIISDPRFAAQIRDPEGRVHKFDDIGDAIHWMHSQAWFKAGKRPGEFWVKSYQDGKTWLDARKAWYVTGVVSPMDYGFAALAKKRSGAISYEEMERRVLEKGLSSRCTMPGQHSANGHGQDNEHRQTRQGGKTR